MTEDSSNDPRDVMQRARTENNSVIPRVPFSHEISPAVKGAIAQYGHGRTLEPSDRDKFIESMKNTDKTMHLSKPIQVEKGNKKVEGGYHSSSSALMRKDEIIRLMAQHDVLIVTGEMGCGKSTGIPLSFLEEAEKRKDAVNIAVFQPRKVACSGLANYMARLREESIGSVIGYAVAEKKQSGSNLNMRPYAGGVQLANNCQGLSAFSHIIIDEAHELGEGFEELLLLSIRALKSPIGNKPKLVLMSATLYGMLDELTTYFERNGLSPAHFDAGTGPFEIKTLRASSLAVLMSSKLASTDSPMAKNMMCLRNRLIPRGGIPREHTGFGAPFTSKYYPGFDVNTEDHLQEVETRFNESQILSALSLASYNVSSADFQTGHLQAFLFEMVDFFVNSTYNQGSVLVFLPRVRDCETAATMYKRRETKYPVRVFALHGRLPTNVQREIVSPAQEDELRVIFSTTIAESSLTIPNISFVIDCGRSVTCKYQHLHRKEHTVVEWSSKSTLEQRKGRAGRVKKGFYIKLYADETLNETKELPSSALTRKSISDTILTICNHHAGPFDPFMDARELFTKLSDVCVYEGLERLVDVGALEFREGLYSFTSFGRLAVRFGCNVEQAKQVLLSVMFKSTRAVLAHAASQTTNFMERSTSTTEQCDARAYQLKSNYADFAAMFRVLICYEEHSGGRNAISDEFMKKYGFGEEDMEAFLNNRQAIANSIANVLSANLEDSNLLSATWLLRNSHSWPHIIYPIALATSGLAVLSEEAKPQKVHKLNKYRTAVYYGYRMNSSSAVARKLANEWDADDRGHDDLLKKMKFVIYDKAKSSATEDSLTGIAVVSPTLALLAGGPLKKSQTFDVDKETLWQIMCNGREDRIVTEAVGQVDLTAHESTHLTIKVFHHMVSYFFEEFIRSGDMKHAGFEEFLAEVFSVVAADENLSAFGGNFEIKGNATQRDIVLQHQAPRGLPLNVDPSIQRIISVPRPRKPTGSFKRT